MTSPRSPSRRLEAAAILSSHGLADTSTTALAFLAVGTGPEANPIVATLLETHPLLAVLVMFAVPVFATAVYVVAAEALDLAPWYAIGVSSVGVLVALNNLRVVLVLGGVL